MNHLRVILYLACAMVLAGCNFGRPPAPEPQIVLTTPSAQVAAPGVYHVERGSVVDQATYPGKVALASVQDLYFLESGRISKIAVNNGDMVEEGQAIAALDTTVLNFDLQDGELMLKLAQQRLAQGEVDFRFEQDRRGLVLKTEQAKLAQLKATPDADPNAVAIQELAVKQAELALQQMEGGLEPGLDAEVQRATIGVERTRAGLKNSQITAPFAGQVLFFDALKEGNAVDAYEPVGNLVDPSQTVIEANLVPADMQDMEEGMPVTIVTTGVNTHTIPGVVKSLPQPFGTGSSRATIVAPSDGADIAGLRPGATVDITVERGRADDALWLPPEAIQGYKGNYFVRLQGGGETAVEVGIFSPTRVEIKSGLGEGDEVVGR